MKAVVDTIERISYKMDKVTFTNRIIKYVTCKGHIHDQTITKPPMCSSTCPFSDRC